MKGKNKMDILRFFIQNITRKGKYVSSETEYVTAHAKMSHLSVKTYSRFITYSNRAHSEQNDDTSMPSTFSLFPEI